MLRAVHRPLPALFLRWMLMGFAGRMCRRLVNDSGAPGQPETRLKSTMQIEICRVTWKYHLPLQMGTN